MGVLAMLTAVQPSVRGSYLPPVFKSFNEALTPPQTIIPFPLQTAVCRNRAAGALVVPLAVHVFMPGLPATGVHTVLIAINSTPDHHFAAGPDCRMPVSPGWCVGGASG